MTHILSQNTKLISDKLLTALKNTAPADLEWKQSRDGFDIPVYNGVPLHSTYSVTKEAERQLAAVAADCDAVIAVGVGAGYHLAQLCRDKQIIAVPLNISLFAATAAHQDMSSYLSNIIFCDVSELYQQLYQLYTQRQSVKVAVTVSSYCLAHDREAADRVCRAAAAAAASAKTEVATIRKFGIVWHNNIRKNLQRCFDGGYNMSPLVISSRIILVVGAGYSLTQHVGFIRDNRQLFYIAAADTAAAVLMHNGIVPDSIWTFDAQTISSQHFFCLRDTPQPVRVFADFCSPIYLRTHNVSTTLVFSSHPYRRILEAAGWTLRNIDSGCGNIGAAAVHFFREYFPEIPLVTVGIDFAYYNGYSYSAGSYLESSRLTKQDYFYTAQHFDAGITYRDKSAGEIGGWRTTPLMQGYAAAITEDIFTLSDSPFCRMKHITHDEVSALAVSGEYRLDFRLSSSEVTESDFRRVETEYLKKDKTPLLPLEMAKKIHT